MPAIEGVVGLLQGAVGWISENEGLAQTLAIGLGVLAAAWAVVTAAMWAASLTPVAITVAAIVAAVGLLTAGFDPAPEDLILLAAEMTAGGLGTALNINREQAGAVSVTFTRTSGALVASDFDRLVPYRLGWLP